MANKYGAQHRALRKQWAQRIANHEYPPCTRCGVGITPYDTWHLDHSDDGTHYLGPAHEHCNTSAGGKHARHNDSVRRHGSNPRPASQAW